MNSGDQAATAGLKIPERPSTPLLEEPDVRRGMGIMVSYKELVEIRTQMATMTAMLQAALALQGQVVALDKRVQQIELHLAGKTSESKVWRTVLSFVAGAVTAAISAGASYLYAHLWGG